MRRIPDNAECAQVLIGSIKNLTRPVMALVRLSQGQLISKIISIFILISLVYFLFIKVNMTEVPVPVKFMFLLIGPAMEEYFEIGRSLSTLFSTPVSKDYFIFVRILLIFVGIS